MLNFALIGCGRIAKRHSELLGLGQIPGARLAAVADIDPTRAQAFGERFKIPFYQDFREMLQKEKIDVVTILTPSGMHAEHAVAVAEFKKNIVVEKPMALTLEIGRAHV